jgi:hypothetical protein
MKFTVLGFSQERMVALGLDLQDALILRYFVDFFATGRMVKVQSEGKEYVQLSYKALLAEIPIIGITSKDVLKRRFNQMVEAGIMESYTHRVKGVFSCYRLADDYEALITNTPPSDSKVGRVPTVESEGSDSKVGRVPTVESEQKNPSTNNPSTTSTASPGSTDLPDGEGKGKKGAATALFGYANNSDSFKAIWDAYPRQDNQTKAYNAWVSLQSGKRPVDPAVILSHIKARLEAGAWLLARKNYIPNLEAFIHGRRWEDEIIPQQIDEKSGVTEVCTEPIAGKKDVGTVYFINKPAPGGHSNTTVSAEELKKRVASGEWINRGRYSDWCKKRCAA